MTAFFVSYEIVSFRKSNDMIVVAFLH